MAKTKPSSLVEHEPIDQFEDLPVVETTIAIRNAGDGLSKAMAIENRVIKKNERVYVVLECDCTDVQFPSTKDDVNQLVRKQVLTAGVATIVDKAKVISVINAQRKQNELAEEAKKGIQRIPGTEESEDGE